MSETWTELVHQLHTMGTKTAECLSLLQKTFIYSDRNSLNHCSEQLSAIKAGVPEMSKRIAAMARQDHAKSVYTDIPKRFLEICDQLEILKEMLKKKIDENVLFSDRAITEVSFLTQSLFEILNAATDLVLVKNPILIRYVQESEAMVVKATTEYATRHEERLIEGLCLPVSSSVFLKILDTLKEIARETKSIAESISR